MPPYEWSPEYSTTIRVIDNDHKDLFESINAFYEAHQAGKGAEQVAATIDCLIRYVDEHFEREERFMEQAGYPDFESHRRAHADFADMIRILQQMYTADPMSIDVPKVLNFLSDWLTRHILKIDMQYVPYVSGKKSDGDDELNHQGRLTKSIQVPVDQVELVEEIIEVIAANNTKIEALRKVFHQFNEQSEQARLQRAHKLFCHT